MENNLLEILKTNTDLDFFIEKIKQNFFSIDSLVNISLQNKKPQSWRAAWILNNLISKTDICISEYSNKFIEALNNKPDGHQREILKIILLLDIENKYISKLFDVCLGIWIKIEKQPSVRIKAFEVLMKIADKYPEMLNEINLYTTKEYTQTLSRGIKKSFYKMIK